MIASLLDEMATLIAAGLLVTLSTNIDNLVVLTALAGSVTDGLRKGRNALWMAAALIMGVVLVLSMAVASLPDANLHWLGLVPLAFGVRAALDALKGGGQGGGSVASGSMLVLLLVNSTDTVATGVPLLAETAAALKPAFLVGMGLGSMVLVAILGLVLRQEGLRRKLDRHGAWLAPLVMILVGIYVLSDTGTDIL